MKEVSVQDLCELSNTCYILLNEIVSSELYSEQSNREVIHYCLQILINVTFQSAQVSLSLNAKHGPTTLFETLVKLMVEPDFANDAAWLLLHIVTDGPVNISKLFQRGLFKQLAL